MPHLTLEYSANLADDERIGTSVPYSRSSDVSLCARLFTPISFATSAIRWPSFTLPGYAYAMLLMKCGNSLLV